LEVETFSIRRPPPSLHENEETKRTWYLFPVSIPTLLASHGWAMRHPAAYFRTLSLALSHRPDGLKGLAYAVVYFLESMPVARMASRRSVDRIHNHFANAAANVGMFASEYLGIPWSFTVHGTAEFDPPAGWTLPDKVRRADLVACANAFNRAQIMRFTDPEHWPKLRLVRCGLDPAELPDEDPSPGSRDPTSQLEVLHVGRLSPEKGQLGLLSAFAGCVADGIDARLTIVGDGPMRAALQDRAAELGLGPRVRFAGVLSVRDVLRQMKASDLFVLSSFMEGLPVVLMEAMACGVPCIAPAVAGIPELIEDGRTGVLFPASDWEALGAALIRLGHAPEERAAMSAAGRDRVLRLHHVDAVVAPLVDAFRGGARQSEGPRDSAHTGGRPG
jgi:glycosyltransferase involved in cell wall biosynthesis